MSGGLSGHEAPNKGATDVWLTPLRIIRALGRFDLDPCGEAHWPTADKILTEHGLDADWEGRVWLNPPYSEVGLWVERLASHGSGIALVFARTETVWAQSILPKASSVFFPAKRIQFHRADGSKSASAGAPSMMLAFGEIPDWTTVMPGWVASMVMAREKGSRSTGYAIDADD